MGCWNATCALTHLPIMAGEPVMMLMLAMLDTLPGQCYYHYDDAAPFALPVEGKYDDYGGLEDIQMSDETRQMLKDMTFYSHNNGEYEKIQTTDEMELFRYLKEGDLYIKYPLVGSTKIRYQYTPIAWVMYHKDAFELVRDEIYHRETSNDKGKYGVALLQKLKKNWERSQLSRSKNAKFIEALKQECAANPEAFTEQLMELYTPVTHVWENHGLGYKFCPAYEKTLAKHDELDSEQFLKDLVNYICFTAGLDMMRHSFFGVCGLGSQGTEYYLHKKLAEWTLQHIQDYMDDNEDIDSYSNPEDYLKDSLWLWD